MSSPFTLCLSERECPALSPGVCSASVQPYHRVFIVLVFSPFTGCLSERECPALSLGGDSVSVQPFHRVFIRAGVYSPFTGC